jgi:HD-GYP domain-containing protein (c-di-GMP phosphodiesterase class II)
VAEFNVGNIAAGNYFTEPLFLDDGFILTAPETPVSAQLIESLSSWGYSFVNSEGEQQEFYSGGGAKKRKSALLINSDDKVIAAEGYFNDLLSYTAAVFSKAGSTNRISYQEIAEKMRELVERLKVDRRYLLQVQQEAKPQNGKYLITHTVRSTIIAVTTGLQLKLPAHRLIELGVAAFVHEIGMTKIPSAIVEMDREPSPKEQEMLAHHPKLGYEMLKNNNFPMVISIVAMEHHEQANGEGYPRKLSGEKISRYAKIVSAACSFESVTAQRAHKTADGFEGIMSLLRNAGKSYDDEVIKAIVQSLSIYPIGTYVLLSNNQKAQVVDAGFDPRFPVVRIVGVSNADGNSPVVETTPTTLYILRPLTKEENADGTSPA